MRTRGDLLRDGVDIDAQLAAVRVRVQVVRTEDDVRVDGGDEPGDRNNRSGFCGLFGGGGVSFLCNLQEGKDRRIA